TLQPRDFYHQANRHIYAAMHALFDRGAKIDHHLVATELTRQGTYESAGGVLRLSEINLAIPSAAHIEHYGVIVTEMAVRRRRISAAQVMAELNWNVRVPIDEARERAEALVLGADGDTLGRRQVLGPGEWTSRTMDYLGQSKTNGLAGVSTGLR